MNYIDRSKFFTQTLRPLQTRESGFYGRSFGEMRIEDRCVFDASLLEKKFQLLQKCKPR